MNATTEVTAQNDVKGDSMNTAEKTTQFDDTIEVRGLLGLITWKNDELSHHIDLTIRTHRAWPRACTPRIIQPWQAPTSHLLESS